MGHRARRTRHTKLGTLKLVPLTLLVALAGTTTSARGDLMSRMNTDQARLWTGAVLFQPSGQPISKQATPPEVPQPKLEAPKDPAGEPKPTDAKAAEQVPDGPPVNIGRFVLDYRYAHPKSPKTEDLMNTEIELGQTPEGYVAPRDGIPTVKMRLADVPDRPIEQYRISAIEAITDALRDELTRRDILGTVVRVVPKQINYVKNMAPDDPDFGKDLRQGSTDLKIEIITAFASQVRSLAFGTRIPYEQRVNNPVHDRIRDRSPVQSAEKSGGFTDPNRKDLVQKDALDDYVYRLNRHPGRKVNVALSVGSELKTPDGIELPSVSLDYLVVESKPWFAYFQVSNTGTENTGEWRERFGFIHNQLTGRDDTLSLDFITSSFEDSNAFIASYEAPFFGSERLRWRVFGTWNQFTASDVGQGDTNRDFDGDGWSVGAELIANIFQHRELFIDAVGGVKYQHLRVEDLSSATEGKDDFFLPYVGLRLERSTDIANTNASVNFEFNIPDVAGTDAELGNLGRARAEDSWTTVQWDVSQSVYLEPLLAPRSWRDIEHGSPTLAHELVLSFKGQYAFDSRLVPNFEQTVGGLYTVRGYRESAVAGDGVVIGSAEYRFHVPKAFTKGYRPGPDGKVPEPGTFFGDPFRWVPQQAYGTADWDLILKGFVDVGRTIISDVQGAEPEETLIGVGLGAELQIKSNFSLRVDWGVALEDVPSSGIESGSNRVHFLGTLLF